MIKFIFIAILYILPPLLWANQYLYSSVEQADLYLDFNTNTGTEGDTELTLKQCHFNHIIFCFSIGGYVIAIPDDFTKPLRIRISDKERIIFLL